MGFLLHHLGAQEDALASMDLLNDDADRLINLLRREHGRPVLERSRP
jgi:hypothetical protein